MMSVAETGYAHFFTMVTADSVLLTSGVGLGVMLLGTAISAWLCYTLRPILIRLALAKPDARSLHKIPTPQGGGIAVLLASHIAYALTIGASGAFDAGFDNTSLSQVALLILGSVMLAMIGFIDDMRPLPAWPRLLTQAFVVGLGLSSLTSLPTIGGLVLPAPLTIAVFFLALMWFINLCNFMDGMDLLSVVELTPLFFWLAILLWPNHGAFAVLSLALCGALLGFMPFNWPVAKIFLGDVGSLPLGFLAGMGLVILMNDTSLATALILPLYYLTDASYTLIRRLLRREHIFQAHRQHFYQRAVEKGWRVHAIIAEVLRLNIGLSLLCLLSLRDVALFLKLPDNILPFWPWLVFFVACGLVRQTLLRLNAPPKLKN